MERIKDFINKNPFYGVLFSVIGLMSGIATIYGTFNKTIVIQPQNQTAPVLATDSVIADSSTSTETSALSGSPPKENPPVITKDNVSKQEVYDNDNPAVKGNESISGRNNVTPLTTLQEQSRIQRSALSSNPSNSTAQGNPSPNPIIVDPGAAVPPVHVEDECKQNNTGEYSFTNQISKTLSVRIYQKEDTYRKNPVRELIVNSGQTNTFYDLQAGSYVCFIEEDQYRSDHGIPGNLPYGYHVFTMQSEIRVLQCKSKTFDIK